VLGKDFDGEPWTAAKFCADLYVGHSDREERAWAHASLAELCLLRLCEPGLDASERERWVRAALEYVDELVRAYPSRAEFPVRATLYQFGRYVDWWGTPEFVAALAQRNGARRVSWAECGLLDAAARLIARLDRRDAEPGGGGGSAPASTLDGSASTNVAPRQLAAHGDTSPGAGAAVATTNRRRGPFFDIEMLPAAHGDALWIE
jgi:hypothetical protein